MKTEPNHKITLSPDSNPLCMEYVPDPVEEAEWFAAQSRINAARTVELMDRAKACAEAVFKEAVTFYRDEEVCESEFPFTRESLSAIIFPFLNPQP